MGPVDQLTPGKSASYILEMIMLLSVLFSGVAVAYFRLHHSSTAAKGRQHWLILIIAKFLLFVFLTPITDMIVISWVGTIGQTKLTVTELYFVRSIKFAFVIALFILGVYSRIYRRDVTKNFSKDAEISTQD